MEQPLKLTERGTVHAAHNLHIIKSELERGSFKPNVSGRVGKHEPKVNVYQMAVSIKEDIAVVTVLYLEEVRNDGVAWAPRRTMRSWDKN